MQVLCQFGESGEQISLSIRTCKDMSEDVHVLSGSVHSKQGEDSTNVSPAKLLYQPLNELLLMLF